MDVYRGTSTSGLQAGLLTEHCLADGVSVQVLKASMRWSGHPSFSPALCSRSWSSCPLPPSAVADTTAATTMQATGDGQKAREGEAEQLETGLKEEGRLGSWGHPTCSSCHQSLLGQIPTNTPGNKEPKNQQGTGSESSSGGKRAQEAPSGPCHSLGSCICNLMEKLLEL